MAGQYPNSGALFVNDYKEKDNQPDYKGTMELTIGGEDIEFKMAGWKKQSKNGKTFISMKFEEPENDVVLTPPQRPKSQPSVADDVSDDDLPF